MTEQGITKATARDPFVAGYPVLIPDRRPRRWGGSRERELRGSRDAFWWAYAAPGPPLRRRRDGKEAGLLTAPTAWLLLDPDLPEEENWPPGVGLS